MADDKSGLKRVMLVGNPPDFQHNLGIDILSLEGKYEVLSAYTPQHALSMVKYSGDAPIDLLVAGGKGAVQLIRDAGREKPDAQTVYALIGTDKHNGALVRKIIDKLRANGFNNVAYFKQPANGDELAARIKELIG